MPEPVRILIDKDSQSTETVGLALSYAAKLCKDMPDRFERVVLIVHTQDQIKHTVLGSFFGTAAKNLLAGQDVRLGDGARLSLLTQRKIPFTMQKTVIVVYFADDRLLEQIDGIRGLDGVVAVPDLGDRRLAWADRWNPLVHGNPARSEVELIEDPVVVRALESLTRSINLANGVLNPRDKQAADEVLRILRAYKHKADPSAIKSWAIKNKWQPKAADELARLAARVLNLSSKPSLSKFYQPAARYQRWADHED